MAGHDNQGILEIEVTDQFGNRPVRIRFTEKREIIAASGSVEKIVGQYRSGVWHTLKLEVNGTISGAYDLYWDGKKIAEKFALSEAVKSVERISFRTGAYRDQPNRTTPNQEPAPPLPGADEKEKLTRFLIDNVKVK